VTYWRSNKTLRDETEIKLKRAYWQGVFDASKYAEKSRSEKSDKDRLTSEVWLTALDWILGQTEEAASTLLKGDNKQG
jgi:hypothetical protein